MALIKVLIIFVVILALLNKRLPLYLAMIFGSLLMIVMFRLPLATAGQTALHTLTGWDVWSVNLAMYVISVLVYELDLRHRFEDAQRAVNGLMRDPRRNTSLACMFIGLMQGPATVTICGGMVDTMAGDHLKNDEKAAVATYLRHIPEASVFDLTGTLFQLLQDCVQEFQSGNLNLLFGSTKEFFQRLLRFVKRRQTEVFTNRLGKILDGRNSTAHKIRDFLNAFAKGVVLLDRFVKLDEPFSDRAGHAENATA